MNSNLTVVVGGGAAGIVAAISKARHGGPVLICEKSNRLGKKIMVTGNGRCNLLNDNLSDAGYNTSARHLVKSILSQFGKSEILDFFNGIGLEVYSQDGRIFPVTNQATSVLRVLELELARLSIPVELGFNCARISFSKDLIVVTSDDGRNIECRNVILTGGGKTYPAFGSDGSVYAIARQIGHSIVEPVPSAVPLISKDRLCHLLQGQRIQARARAFIDRQLGPEVNGELLFTKYGLSGTCILDVSGQISIAINREHGTGVSIHVDMVPFWDKHTLTNELTRRKNAGLAAPDMLVGVLPNKMAVALKSLFETGDPDAAAASLKAYPFTISGTRGWNEAEFTSGGINTREVHPATLESKLRKHVYFAGEVFDVDGQRGGYNLAWAWSSGFIAGLTQ